MQLKNMEEKNEKYVRPKWDEYFMQMAELVGERATCDRGRSGCVVVKDKRVVATGYVGSPPGMPHCDDVGHLLQETVNSEGQITKHCVRTTHAEQNAFCQAAKYGVSLDGATIYIHMEPCFVCARMLATIGIKRVVCKKKYHGAGLSRELFQKLGIELKVFEDEMETYKNM